MWASGQASTTSPPWSGLNIAKKASPNALRRITVTTGTRAAVFTADQLHRLPQHAGVLDLHADLEPGRVDQADDRGSRTGRTAA